MADVQPVACYGYIWILKTVLASSERARERERERVREEMSSTELSVKNVVTKDHELKSQLC